MIIGKRSLAFVFVLGGLLPLVGCGSKAGPPPGVDRDTRVRLNIVGNLYRDYLLSHRGNAPKNLEEFREFLQARSGDLNVYIESEVVGSEEELLASARDGQPFIIVCGELRQVSGLPDAYWAAYEQQGVDGKRLAIKTYGGEQLLDSEEFAREFP